MTVYQQLIEVCSPDEGELLTSTEIKSRIVERFGTNPNSILPSDFCYNRWNAGIQLRNPLFVRVGAGEYRYIGPAQPYTGLVFWRPKGEEADQVIGEWADGELTLYQSSLSIADTTEPTAAASPVGATIGSAAQKDTPIVPKSPTNTEGIPLSPKQLDRLYEEYMEILTLEVSSFGCKPTETRHLIGRLGEFYCARVTRGQLARRVNQEGFDVITSSGRRVSVKTTAQRSGFVSLNVKTAERADDLMVLRYHDGDFEVIYHGEIAPAVQAARTWEGRFELDLTKARRLAVALITPS
ncbi:MAG: hypothetical protein ACAF41_34705 (plasmid) [Leptolyngbya sp. BL-A-14]